MDLNRRYDTIGEGYATTRREDPRVLQLIEDELGPARTVLNVGAGTGSYEPRDRHVIAVEPSDVMAAQRSRLLAPAIRAGAENLPLRDNSVDAAMGVLTLHHWSDRERGVREMRRVSSGPVILVTCDPEVSGNMWLMKEYLTEVADLDRETFPSMEELTYWLGPTTRVETIPIPRETPDWTLMSFWAHPERVLNEAARNATSGFARQSPAVINRVVSAVAEDLESGRWDEKHGHLRLLNEYDAGLRLVVSA